MSCDKCIRTHRLSEWRIDRERRVEQNRAKKWIGGIRAASLCRHHSHHNSSHAIAIIIAYFNLNTMFARSFIHGMFFTVKTIQTGLVNSVFSLLLYLSHSILFNILCSFCSPYLVCPIKRCTFKINQFYWFEYN